MSYTYYKRGMLYFRINDAILMEYYNFNEGVWGYWTNSSYIINNSLPHSTLITEEEVNTVLMLRELQK